MELIPEWAPNIHPMLVHFPVAILSIAILFDFISFFLPEKQKWWSPKATAFLYGIGAATAIVVYFTGKAAANSLFLQAEAQVAVNIHSNWAWRTVWFYGIYTVARILATWKVTEKHLFKVHLGFFILSFFGFYLLWQTGEHGAKMVFKYGAGVKTAQVEETVKSESPQTEPRPTAFNINENGDWVWQIESGAIQILENKFHFLNGGIEGLNAETVQTSSGEYALRFSGDNLEAFFVTNKSYQNVQVDYYLTMTNFNGTVTLTNHIQDDNSYDFVSISSEGIIRQGRVVNGEVNIFAEGTVDVSKPIFARVVAAGTHFRGYVDKELVVHGHGDAPEPGSIGIKIEGSGTVLFRKISLTQL